MQKKTKIAIALIVSLCCFNLMYGLRAFQSLDSKEGMGNLRLFVDVVARLQNNYVDKDKVTTKNLIYGALEGMLTSLDENSRFHEPKEQKIISDETEGHYAGLGIIIRKVEKGLRVTSVLPETPAEEAGILPEDILTYIGNHDLAKLSHEDALDKLRGTTGSVASLQIYRAESKKDISIDVKRRRIYVSSVRDTSVLENGMGYLRITSFARKTGSEVEKALDELVNKQKCPAIVIDLRNNPGGLLDAAVDVCNHFLPKDSLVVYTEGRHDHHSNRYYTQNQGLYSHVPLLILVNQNSASASEIVSSCLRDWNKAIIAGDNSYGKGSVQNIIPLRDGSSVRFTIAYYYTKSGRKIDQVGVAPDFSIKISDKEESLLTQYLESYEKESMGYRDTQLLKACENFQQINAQEKRSAALNSIESDPQVTH